MRERNGPDKHRRLLEDFVGRFRRDPEIQGVMLTGSLARGDALPGSDLDLLALLAPGRSRPFAAQMKDGVHTEIHYRDPELARRRIETRPLELYSYLDGRIVYDTTGELAQLVELARRRFEQYRTPAQEKRDIAYWLRSARIKLQAALDAGDALRAGYLASTNTWKVLEGLWAVNDLPMPPGGAVWAHVKDLKRRPDDLDVWLRELFTGDTQGRARAALHLIRWIVPRLDRSD